MNAYAGTYRVQGDQIDIHMDISINQKQANTIPHVSSRSMVTGSR